jgi:8-hydroxy-5-deazaflavin:NADPH oxidoreductase
MKIGILGSGDVGQQLGLGFIKLGHEIKIGTRDIGKLEKWLKNAGRNASVGSFEEAAKFGKVIVFAIKWIGTENAIKLAGKDNFDGKIVIDVTNPLIFEKNISKLDSSPGKSAAEKIQKLLDKSRVVKAFNIINAFAMCNPRRKEGDPDLFICGNEEGKKFVGDIANHWGWKSIIDLGDISKSYLIEALAMIYIEYAMKENNWNIAFKLLKR